LFRQAITGGDVLTNLADMESFKLSYDYLTYFWKHGNSELRLKTLYEVQRISVNSEVDDFQVDTTGALANINPIIIRNRSFSRPSGWGWSTLCHAIFAGKRADRLSGCCTAGTSSMRRRKSRFA